MQRIYPLLALLLTALPLLGQPEDESPYSSSNTDVPPGDFWATNGLVIFAAVVFFGLMIFLALRGRKRA